MAVDQITIDVDELMRPNGNDYEKWMRHSIYRIPAHMKNENPRAYTPQMVSIGPYHFGAPHLAAMQAHKKGFLRRFLTLTNKSLEYYIDALAPLTQELLDSYQLLDEHWRINPTKFLELMVLDCVFLIELMYCALDPSDDHSKALVLDSIRKFSNDFISDIMMMENQLPFTVLRKLISLDVEAGIKKQVEELMSLMTMGEQILPLHNLNMIRACFIACWDLKSTDKYLDPLTAVKSASELQDAGVRFQANYLCGGISFMGGTLNLPVLVVDDSWTESVFLNIIAFEKLHPTGGTEISSFFAFMQGLIISARDVSILQSSGVIEIKSRGSNVYILNWMNQISKNVLIDPSSELCEVRDSLNNYYDNKMKNRRHRMKRQLSQWWQNLLQTHFKSPWTILSLFAGTVLLVLTLLQTLYSMKTYYNGKSPSF